MKAIPNSKKPASSTCGTAGLCGDKGSLHNRAMEITPSEPWFGRRRPWLWLGAAFGSCAILALITWGLVVRSAHSAVETERARSPYPASFLGPGVSAPEPDALAVWVQRLERTPPEPFYPGQWPDTQLQSASRALPKGPGMGFVPPGLLVSNSMPYVAATIPAECGAAPDALNNHPGGVEGWLGQHLADPVLAGENQDCVRALLRERIGSEALQAHALTARELVRAEGPGWLARMERDDQAVPEPVLVPLPAVIRHLGALAALRALEGDAAAARSALQASLGLCDSLAGLGWHEAYVRWLDCERMALRGVAACIALSPEAVDAVSLARHLDGLGTQARHIAACELQRALCDRAYERLLAGKPCGAEHFDLQPEPAGWRTPLLEREQADALASWRRYAEWAREPLAARAAPPVYERHRLASDDYASTGLGATMLVTSEALAHLEAQVAVLRVALVARRDGLEAAKVEASRLAPSAGGRALTLRPASEGLTAIEARSLAAGALEDSTLDVFVRARP